MTAQPTFDVQKNAVLTLHGRELLVTALEEDSYAVECQETGECLSLPFEKVDTAIRERNCEVVNPRDAEKRHALLEYAGGLERLEQFSEETRRIVQARLALVLAQDALRSEGMKLTQCSMSKRGEHRRALLVRADEIAPGHDFLRTRRGGKLAKGFEVPQGRTLANYRDVYHRFDRNPVVLADRDHKKGRRGDRLLPWQERFIEYVLQGWHDPRKPKLAKVYTLAKAAFDRSPEEIAQPVDFPTITTIRTRAKAKPEIARVLGRGGKRHANNVKGAGSTDVRALYFGEKAEWDQCLLSIFSSGDGVVRAKAIDPSKVPKELTDNEIRRCWLHVIMDIATREVLGWIISETADADHSKALLRMATRDKTKEKIRYGCKRDPVPPVRLGLTVADNGTATRNSSVYASQLGMGMTVMTARAYQPMDKQVVERLFGTTQWDVLNFMEGYTGSRPGELTGYDPKAAAKISHDDVFGALTRYFIDEYPFRQHRGTGMYKATPRQKREEALRRYGPIDPPSQRDRCLHLGVKVQASTTSEGVRAFNIPFNSTELQRFAGGASKLVTVHLDPDDLRKVYITAEGVETVMEARLSMTVFKDQSLEEAIEIMESATKSNPTLRAIHDAHLSEAIARRARESGFFPDSRDPANFQTIAQLEERAAKLLQVETRPASYVGATVTPGSLMSRTGSAGVVRSRPSTGTTQTRPPASSHASETGTRSGPPARQKRTPVESSACAEPETNDVKYMTFEPIKDSKL
ncbi:integrase catalytic domain-containing protein [Salipiger mangrovisoli]|uniref:Transposase family protein n=1 Tax=Salipiger mangrovisoli TaxID=2865933 RepID=A0ABR9XBQ9_9RHOB|nr:Mu transposase C-terminal domain-containing protein [Salipiger mangrovisoli]MBE9640865.1 transposase family protein [Salipiger mangrovisoli]